MAPFCRWLRSSERNKDLRRKGFLSRLRNFETLEPRQLLASDWTNVLQPLNTTGEASQSVEPLDVLVVINEINGPQIRDSSSSPLPPAGANGKNPPPYVDVDCDNYVTPLDVLLVINAINSKRELLGWQFSQQGGNGGTEGSVTAQACHPVLREGSSFVTSLTTEFTVPIDATGLVFEYSSLNFDSRSDGLVRDAFEAALLSVDDVPLVYPIAQGRDAFYNVTEGVGELASAEITVQSGKVSVSLANVLPGTRAKLVLRLVNNDSDTQSSVSIDAVRFESTAPGPLLGALIGPIAPTIPPAFPASNLSFPGTNTSISSPIGPSSGDIVGRVPGPGDSTTGGNGTNTANAGGGSGLSSGSTSPPLQSAPIDSRGTEFWVGFPDNLFEANRPQKVLYITGDVATSGVVDIPGLIDPATSLPFHQEFIVNPGVVSVVELPSMDVGDSNDDETDFDVEVELIAKVQRKGIHVVTQEPVTVYGLDLAISTSDAFLALPVNALGKEYINLGYENTYASIAHVEGTQFLVVAAQDNTDVTITPGRYSGATTASNAAIRRPNGSTEFNLGSGSGTDIGPYVTDAAGTHSLTVVPPFDGYSGTYNFELIDVATAAVPANIGDKVTVNFPTGREAKVVSFDVQAGQRLYYDAVNPNPAPNVTVRILSASGEQGDLSSQTDNDSFVYRFGALQFRETGKYYFVITGEQSSAFDFSFRLINMDVASKINLGTDYTATVNPGGRAEVYRLDGDAGQALYYNALDPSRLVVFSVYGPGGQQVFSTTASDSSVFVLPETSTYYIVLDSVSFLPSSFGFRILDLKTAPVLPLASPTTTDVSTGHATAFRFSGLAAQTFSFDIQSVTPFFRVTYQLFDSSGNAILLSEVGNQRFAKLMTNGSYTLLIGALTVQEGGTVTILPSLIDDPVIAKAGFNTTQTLTIAAGGTATYSFTAPAGTRVLVDGLNTATENLYVEFNAPDGTRLYTGFGVANDYQDIPRYGPAFLPQSGTYTLTVRGNTPTDSGSYNFRVLDLDTAGTPIALDSLINGNFPDGREALVYTIDANVGDQLLFDGRSGNFIFGIYSPTLNGIYGRGIFGAASTAEVDGVGRVLQSGRYYVLFQGDLYIPRDFSFSIQNLNLAPSLAIGAEANGTVDVNGQVVYRMPLTSGQRIRFDNLLPYNGHVNYRISNAGGRILYDSGFQNSDSGPPGNRLVSVTEPGEYFVSIQSRQATPATYRFRIDDLAMAPLLAFDTDLEVTLSPGNAARVFRIEATAGETLQFDNFGSFLPLNWEVSGPITQFRGGSNDGSDFNASVLSTGTHYFTISGRQDSGPITIRFRATRTPGPVVPLTGVNIPVTLDVAQYEAKTYSFNAPTGRLVYLNVLRSEFAIPTQTVTLNEGETYLLRDLADRGPAGAADLTGSIISSTKPVAVFGGNRATFIPSEYFAADHLVEQLPPTDTWGQEFVTMPLVTGSTRGDRFRFLAQADNTEVKVNGVVAATINRGQFYEQVIVGPAHMVSNKPMLVAQYAQSQNYYRTDPGGNPNFQGDPLMMIVPPFEQFLANYTVSTPVESSILNAQRFDRNYINLVAPADAVGLIEVDGVPIEANQFVAIGTSGFFGAVVSIDLGAYQLAGPLPFGAFVYGFGSFDSYGYVGGQSLSPVASVRSILLSPATANPQIGNSFDLTARVADISGSPLPGIRVDFDVAGVNPQRGFAFSDANGEVLFSYTGTNPGRDIVTASVGQILDDSILDWRSAAIAPQLIVTAPSDGSSITAGTTVVATGIAITDFPLATLDLVIVNGVPLANVDAAGNFFASLFVGPGDNEFEFLAIDSNGKTTSEIITLRGTQRDESKVDFSQFADVTGSFRPTYARTSYNENSQILYTEAAIENIGQFSTDVPLLVGISNISDPTVLVRDAAGQTPDGVPYYDFTGLVTGGTLNPTTKTGFLAFEFHNPSLSQFTYDLVFYGKLNQPPQIKSLPPTEADLNREYRYDVVAVDPNNDAIEFELVESPDGMTIDRNGGQIRWTTTNATAGVYSVTVRVSDSRQGVGLQSFLLSVRPIPANRAPLFTSLPTSVAYVGLPFPYSAQAVDVDGDTLRYRLALAPAGMLIDAESGVIQWIPTPQHLGEQQVTIEVTDARGGIAEQSFSLLVLTAPDNLNPVILSSPLHAVKLGQLSYQVIALDGDEDPLTYRLLAAPSGMTISATGLIDWLPTASQLGPHEIAIEVLDARGGRASQSFLLAVFDNQDPVITSQPIVAAQVNSQYLYQVIVTDSIDDLLAFQLIDAPLGMTIHPSSGRIQWDVPTSSYAQESVTLEVHDGRGGSARQQFEISVAGGRSQDINTLPFFVSTPPTTASVGDLLKYQVRARDADGDALSFDLPLGPNGMMIDPSTGQLGWLPTPDQTGVQQVAVRVQDGRGGLWMQSFQIQVDGSNTAPRITSSPLTSATVGLPWEYRLHAQDAEGDPVSFEIVSPQSGMTITPMSNSDTGAVLTFTPVAAGEVNVILAVSDGRGGRSDQQFIVQVASTSANVAPVIHSVPRLTIPAGQTWVYFVDADDSNGDPLTLSLLSSPTGMTLDSELRMASWTPSLAQLGSHAFELNVRDGRGGITSQVVTLDVVASSINLAPRIVSPPSAYRATLGESFIYNLVAEDDDGDPVEWTLMDAPQGASLDPRYGTMRWIPTVDQLGLQRFIVSAKDPSGLEALQSFSLNATGTNLAPTILSRPVSEAVVNERYVYGVRAIDPENDRLIFTLKDGPSGMTIDAMRGIVRWTPTIDQLGTATASVEVIDVHGNKSLQQFQVNVSQTIRNQDPIITSRAVFRARVDAPYQYDVNALDPEGNVISYSLVTSPTGMQIDATTGLITWTPTVAQTGSHLVQVLARDSAGGQSTQRFAVLARVNQAPVIVSEARTSVSLGEIYHYDLRVTDAEGDGLTYTLATAPLGMTIDGFGRILWQTNTGVETINPIAVRVTDSFGAVATQVFDLAVTPDTTAPRVELRLSATPISLGADTIVVVQATDNVLVSQVRLTLDGQLLVLDSENSITIRGHAPGLFTLHATARDSSGNEGIAEITLRVFDPADTQGPTIDITSPQPNAILTTLTDIVGSITDDHLQFYRIEYARADLVDVNDPIGFDTDYQVLETGTSSAMATTLAIFDPTLLTNDNYVIRVIAQDLSGNVSTKTLPLSIDGQLKLGQYAIDLNDLSIPLNGIPIIVQRSYDTLRAAEVGDFGYGWRLSILDADIRESTPINPLEAQGLSFAATPFRAGAKVYLTNPEGRRVGFTFSPTPQFSLFGGGSFLPRFVPDQGVYDTLDVGSVPLRQVNGSFFSGFFGDPFNPNAYRLTTKDGTTYEYNQFNGLDNVHDRNGNRLEFRSDGIFSPDGQSVRFLRDPQGRISEIIDPAGNQLHYRYNLAGDLVEFQDQAGLQSTYSYLNKPSHFLKTIVDPNGHQVFSAQFDSDGRLASSTNSIGAKLSNAFDLENLVETTTDPLGNDTQVQFDARGNITRVTRPGGAVISMQYDSQDNLIQATDEAGDVVTQAYDSRGNMVRIVDPLGAAQTNTYNDKGALTSTTDALGRNSQLVYDANGNLTQFVNALGLVTTADFDSQGRVTATTDANGNGKLLSYGNGPKASSILFAGRVLNGPSSGPLDSRPSKQFEYNQSGQVVREIDENGHETRYLYDSLGRPVSSTDALGGTYRYVYEGTLLVEGIDPLGRSTKIEYDALGRKIREIDPSGGVNHFTYDANNQLTLITDPLGRQTSYRYRPDGRIDLETDAAGGVTRYEYDAVGHRTAIIDALQNRWTYEYDSLGRLLSETNPLGAVTRYAYDAQGNWTSTTDANGNTTRYEYDNLNRLVVLIDPLNRQFKIEYDNNGNPIAYTDAVGSKSRFEYDDMDRLIRAIDAAGFTRHQTFDAFGNKTSVTNEVGDTVQLFYDAANRGVGTRDSAGNTTTRILDAVGNTVRFINELGQAASFEIDPFNRILATSTTDGRIRRTEYDAVGNTIRFSDPLGNSTSMEYDALNRMTRRIDPLSHATTFQYDALGELTNQIDRNGREIRFVYDSARRLVSEQWFSGSTQVDEIHSSYDAVGNLLTSRDTQSSLTFTFDALNRISSQDNVGTNGVPRTVLNATYAMQGSLSQLQASGGTLYSRTFDARGLTLSSNLSGGGVDPLRVDFGYDAVGRRISETRFADLAGTQKVGRSTWLTNAQGQLTDLTHFSALDAILADYDYEYDSLFQLTDETGSSGSVHYDYDSAGQLVAADRTVGPLEAYRYDQNGNRLGAEVILGANNQLLRDQDYTYTYDNEGNRISQIRRSNNESLTFTYDHRNRMTDVVQRNASGMLTGSARFMYDTLDRRILVESNGVETSTVYFGDAPWADFDASGQLLAQYLPGDDTDQLLARYRTGEGVSWYLTDRLGSVREITDNTGAISDRIAYDSFGNVTSETNPARGDRFKFTGRELDSVSGLYYYRARYYDPKLGVFVGEDPLVFGGGDSNLRRFVGNDPVNATDPSGQQAISASGGLAAFVSFYADFALNYGKDEPFTFRVGCKPGACGISGATNPATNLKINVGVPGSGGALNAGLSAGTSGVAASLTASAGPLSQTVGPKGVSTSLSGKLGDFNAKATLNGQGKLGEEVGGPGPFSPSFSSDKANVPNIPNLPRSGEFNFLVQATATGPHLVIAADIAIYVGVAEQLALIAKVTAANDWETIVTVDYEAKSDNPNAAVKSTGFAVIPRRNSASTGGANPNSGSRGPQPGPSNPPGNGSGASGNGNDPSSNGGGASSGPTFTAFETGGGAAATIGDRVWVDSNKNGTQDPGESGVPGVALQLYFVGLDELPGTSDDVLVARVTTDRFGFYVFADLLPAAYMVQLDLTTLPIGFVLTVPNLGTDDRDSDANSLGQDSLTTLEAGEVDLTHDFGIIPG